MNIVLLGLPGAGKGTQARNLARKTSLAHITTGELFRENIRKGTTLGLKAKPYYETGQLVPDEITIGMLMELLGAPETAKGCLFDGFPRTLEQAQALDRALAERSRAIDIALYIKVPPEELVERLAGRWNCPNCGAVYHQRNSPPRVPGVCDNCGAALYQREDDRPEVARKRLEVNQKQLDGLLEYYREQGKLVEIDGQQDIEGVESELASALTSLREA
ncbi:MAG TPA: adenylate kinase [Dehalococcoidia bacterium]|nr:adenylate kinase [Dehalococcoidia bacterium]